MAVRARQRESFCARSRSSRHRWAARWTRSAWACWRWRETCVPSLRGAGAPTNTAAPLSCRRRSSTRAPHCWCRWAALRWRWRRWRCQSFLGWIRWPTRVPSSKRRLGLQTLPSMRGHRPSRNRDAISPQSLGRDAISPQSRQRDAISPQSHGRALEMHALEMHAARPTVQERMHQSCRADRPTCAIKMGPRPAL